MIEVYYMSVLPLEEETLFLQAKSRIDARRLEKVEQTKRVKDKLLCMGAGLLLQYSVKRRTEGTVTDSSAVICRQLQVTEILKAIEEPLDLSCAYGIQGKPYLEKFPEIYFSLSHSGEYALCAICDREIGADVQQMEKIQGKDRKEQIAARQFVCTEREWISGADTQEEKDRRFYRIWAGKEAYIKLTGQGLSQGMNSFWIDQDKSLIIDEHAPGNQVRLYELRLPDGYVAAACIYE